MIDLNELSLRATVKKTRNHKIRFLVKNWLQFINILEESHAKDFQNMMKKYGLETKGPKFTTSTKKLSKIFLVIVKWN